MIKDKFLIIAIFIIGISLILFAIAIDYVEAEDNSFIEGLIQEFIVNASECEAYRVVANGLIYFNQGGEQIATYTNVFDYLADGLEYIDLACN